ncbi:MBL fold metallo-hydrolase [Bacillus sp. MRMR6]|uniref:MBL fold metallo-hydrolase n=1 Tax=Bacillus sp. MRMR6 TaxID=1928617 RepID=UPI000AE0CEFA|nr:MBL fold metallo-hydrolase [Bacillus sp. MRMR6]
MARIEEIAPDIYRISIFAQQVGMQFNHFLVKDDEPLLYHAGLRAMFPEMKEALSRIINPSTLRWIGFSHFESDECGALNEWLTIAPNATAVTGLVGALVNVNDFALRPARILQENELLITGKKEFRHIRTPHVPHGWDAGLLFEGKDKTLFTSDLFHQNGDVEALTESSLSDRCRDLLRNYQQSPFSEYIPYSSSTEKILQNLAELNPLTLATMHGSSFRGDGKKAIKELGEIWKEELGERS